MQRLISKHKQELRRLRGLHEAELQQAEERAAQRQLRQVEELRVRLEQEKEELGRQERERARQRWASGWALGWAGLPRRNPLQGVTRLVVEGHVRPCPLGGQQCPVGLPDPMVPWASLRGCWAEVVAEVAEQAP